MYWCLGGDLEVSFLWRLKRLAVNEDGMMARRDPFLYEVERNRSSAGENGEWRLRTMVKQTRRGEGAWPALIFKLAGGMQV